MNKEQNTKDKDKALHIGGVLWRLSAVFFLMTTVIVAITYMPVKWVLTGKYYLDSNKQTNLMYRWGKKCGF